MSDPLDDRPQWEIDLCAAEGIPKNGLDDFFYFDVPVDQKFQERLQRDETRMTNNRWIEDDWREDPVLRCVNCGTPASEKPLKSKRRCSACAGYEQRTGQKRPCTDSESHR